MICSLCGQEFKAEYMMEFGLCPACYARMKASLSVLTERLDGCDFDDDEDKYRRLLKLAQLLKSLCEFKLDYTDRGVELFEDIEDYIDDTVKDIFDTYSE